MAPTTAEKNSMVQFIAERLENSLFYNILKVDESHIWVKEKPEIRERPRRVVVMAHDFHMKTDDFKAETRKNPKDGWYTSHIFYNDEDTFFVPLTDKLKASDSLRVYHKGDIDNMINLREIEKRVLKSTRGWGNRTATLVYYEPGDLGKRERIVAYKMRPVKIPRYEEEGYNISKNYKIPGEVEVVTAEDVAHFAFKKEDPDGIATMMGETAFRKTLQETEPLLPSARKTSERMPELFLSGLTPMQLIYLTQKLGADRLRDYAMTPK